MALTKKYAWYPERERIGLVEIEDSTSGSVKSVTESGLIMRILATRKPSDFTMANDEADTTSAFPPQFHHAITYRVIAELYRDPRNQNIELAEYYMNEYRNIVRLAKHYGKRGHIGFGAIKGYGY